MKWIKVEDALPKRGQKVIAFYVNEYGKKRTVMAIYIAPFTEYACDFYDGDAFGYECDYKDGDDEGYVQESWHEQIDNWDAYSGCHINSKVTHWMPLPDAPKAG